MEYQKYNFRYFVKDFDTIKLQNISKERDKRMNERNVTLTDLVKGVSIDNVKLKDPITVPDSAFREMLEQVLERGTLENISSRDSFYVDEDSFPNITWMKIVRLPVSPDNAENYDLFNRWQGVLSSMHEWGYRFYFMLQRKKGETALYIGANSDKSHFDSKDAIEQIMEATSGSMPGIELHHLNKKEQFTDISMNMMEYKSVGAVTGLPSFFNEKEPGVLQTLDPLTFGIKGIHGDERDYCLLVIADPISDTETSDIMNRMRTLGSEIHTFVERSVSETQGQTEQKQVGVNQFLLGQVGGSLIQSASAALGSINPILGIVASVAGIAAGSALSNLNKTISTTGSITINTTHLDKFAEYAEELLEIHVERMKQGRNLGYWNVGTYVLGKNRKDVATVNGMLRSIYAGRESYVEPIRIHMLDEKSGALDIVKNHFNMIPLFDNTVSNITEQDEWHIFGKYYQYLSTPMNTKEFALATSLPKRDAPGLRFVKTAVRFANNPPIVSGDSICLGNVVNMGVDQTAKYYIDHNDFVRHSLVVGSTGSGKTCTCKRILKEILDKDIPALIIEPAKDEYVRWAIEMNKTLPKEKKFRIYMPGFDEFEGTPLQQLQLCPFEPAAIPGAKVDMMARCENLISILNASLPSEDVLPVLIDETVYALYNIAYPNEFESGSIMEQKKRYPLLSMLTPTSAQVMKTKKYEEKVRSNLATCLETRFQYLVRGTRGKLLNVIRSTEFSEIFDHPTVINISGISAARDKALIMSILMLSLYEYRKSKYTYDLQYREKAQKNELLHLTLIEEAHNLLLKPEGSSANNPQKVVADLFTNILSEIRSYGEGMMIVDQYPTRLIPDAIKNTNYKIVHRLTSPDDTDIMAAGLALRDEQKALIPCLSPGNAIVYGDRDDAAAWIHMKKIDE